MIEINVRHLDNDHTDDDHCNCTKLSGWDWLYIIVYQLLFLCFIIPPFVFGGLTINNTCLNSQSVSAFVWFFVFASSVTILNGLSYPLLYLFVTFSWTAKRNLNTYKVLGVVSGIVLLFITGWLAYGIDLLLNLYNAKCGTLSFTNNNQNQVDVAIHAMKTIFAYELIWLILLVCLILGGIVALIIYSVMLYRLSK